MNAILNYHNVFLASLFSITTDHSPVITVIIQMVCEPWV